jgi:hypothetical protein
MYTNPHMLQELKNNARCEFSTVSGEALRTARNNVFVGNYHYTPRNNPAERISQLLCGESLNLSCLNSVTPPGTRHTTQRWRTFGLTLTGQGGNSYPIHSCNFVGYLLLSITLPASTSCVCNGTGGSRMCLGIFDKELRKATV